MCGAFALGFALRAVGAEGSERRGVCSRGSPWSRSCTCGAKNGPRMTRYQEVGAVDLRIAGPANVRFVGCAVERRDALAELASSLHLERVLAHSLTCSRLGSTYTVSNLHKNLVIPEIKFSQNSSLDEPLAVPTNYNVAQNLNSPPSTTEKTPNQSTISELIKLPA